MTQLLSWHRVGQRVVCVDATPSPHKAVPLREGQIYTIREVFEDQHWPEHTPHFRLEEIVGDVDDWALGRYEEGWRHQRFRPVKETSIEQFRTLLNLSPKTTRELVEEDA